MSDDEDSNPKGGDARFLLAIYIIFPTLFGLYVFALCCGGPCCYCLNRLDEWSLSQNSSRRPSVPRVLHVSSVPNNPNVPDDPPETETDRLEGEPRVCDVCITPWYPLCSQSDPLPGRLELDRRGKNDANRTANSQNRPRWRGFLVSRVHPINPFRYHSTVCSRFVPGYPATVCG
jgi:hypothetical protein